MNSTPINYLFDREAGPGTASRTNSELAAVVQRRPRLDQLDSLRGVCAVMVVLFHLQFIGVGFNIPVVSNGYLFVDFFFVLSGFIMYFNYGKLAGLSAVSHFLGLRFFRIYPMHLFMLLAFLAYGYLQWIARIVQHSRSAVPPIDNDWLGVFLNVTLVNGLGIRPPAFNIPSWSISAEFWTYLIFAVVVAVMGRITARPLGFAAIFVVVSTCGLALLLGFARPLTIGQINSFALPRCVLGFFLGAGLCAVLPTVERHGVNKNGGTLGVLLQLISIAAVLILVSISGDHWPDLLLPYLFTAVIAAFAYWPGTWLVSVVRSRPLLWLGARSYSIYMVHWFILLIVAGFARNVLHVSAFNGRLTVDSGLKLFLMSASIAAVLTVASITYRCVEEPGRRLGRRLLL
jgi:peptidoglycan/LPS O-acetylase OafA/YrhL